jgi:hypothetical protein
VIRGALRLAGALLLTAVLAPVPAGSAGASTASGTPPPPGTGDLSVRVEEGDGGRPVVVLTNRGDAACRVAAVALGTVRVTAASQGGAAIRPSSAPLAFGQDPRHRIAETLRVLEPGRSADLRLPTVPRGSGVSLMSATLATTTRATAWLFPVAPGRPLDVEVAYELPVTPRDDGPPPCAATSAKGSVVAGAAPAGRGVPGPAVALAAGAALLGVAAVVVVVVVLRRRRRAAAVVTAVLALGALHVTSGPGDAAAVIIVSPGHGDAYGLCAQAFGAPGGDPAGIFPVLSRPDVRVTIIDPEPAEDSGTLNWQYREDNGDITVSWNSGPAPRGPAGPDEECGTLYHELFHAYEDGVLDKFDDSECVTAEGPTGIPVGEVNATRAENQFRAAVGLPPLDSYGYLKLPAGPCRPPPPEEPPPACTGSCGSSYADPHLDTFDGRHYSFQAVGEFVAARSERGGFEVQVRQLAAAGVRYASRNRAVAMRLGGARLEVRQREQEVDVLVSGRPVRLGRTLRLPGGGTLRSTDVHRGARLTATAEDRSVVHLWAQGNAGVRLDIQPAASHRGRLEGLFGDFDGRPENDLRTRDGGTIAAERPSHDDLYPRFADTWRVTPASSLFTYPPGEGTETHTDRTFPERLPEPGRLPGWQAAESLCRSRGVTDPVALADCTFDVAITGDADYAVAAVQGQALRGAVGIDGPPVTVRLGRGDSARLAFAGRAGQEVTLSVATGDEVPVDCGALRVVDERDDVVAQGCLAGGNGGIGAFTLPADGTYRVVVQPRAGSGTARLTLSSVTAIADRLRPGGAPVDVAVDRPGRAARVTFEGRAGQRLYLAAAGSFPIDCGALRVVDAAGRDVASGCTNGDRGEIDAFRLPSGGRHTVVVDTRNDLTGTLRLTLFEAAVRNGTIAVGGPPVRATVAGPGGVVRLTFDARAGDAVTVTARTRDMPTDCGALAVLGPREEIVGSGCVAADTGGIPGPLTLRATGRYTLVLDPGSRTTGSAELRVTRR